ncbi:MAG TPA: peptide ABC transporter permease [Gammaproteobacteria bacterium]|nr:peptide ABC transporter permease [Gammaproteobacteria bacterium]
MIQYIIRRLFYSIPILIGVNLITFAIFFLVNSPDDVARMHLGTKYVTPEAVERWKQDHGYHLPLVYNQSASGVSRVTETIFYHKSFRLFLFDFGRSDSGRDIGHDVRQRMWPSLAIMIPMFLGGLIVNIAFALFMVFFRGTKIDFYAVVFCVLIMSISTLFFVIFAQYLFGKLFQMVPISGFVSGWSMWKFLLLPVVVGIVAGMGGTSRWYRTLFLEEVNKDYVRTARAKGMSEARVLFGHVFRNALIPILTGTVVVIPMLFMGSLIFESFFAIPGLGSYTIEAIQRQDFAIVRSMVFLGSVIYIVALLATDITYTWADPRIRLS